MLGTGGRSAISKSFRRGIVLGKLRLVHGSLGAGLIERSVLRCGLVRRGLFGGRILRRKLGSGNFASTGSGEHHAALLLHFFDFAFDGVDYVIVIFQIFEEVADIQEGVAIQTDIDEGRLHAGQHARDAAFVDAAD